MGACDGFMKWTLFVVNILTLSAGAALVAIGGYMIAEKEYMEDILGSSLFIIGSSILIAAGAIIVVLSFFGCCGALRREPCLLYAYGTLLLIIFVVVLTGGILAIVFKSDVEEALEEEMKKTMDKYHEDEDAQKGWDAVQSKLQCCGINGPNDWLPKLPVPGSCCDLDSVCLVVNSYQDGCYEKVKTELEKDAKLLGGIGIGVAVFMLLAIIFSCSLARSSSRKAGYHNP